MPRVLAAEREGDASLLILEWIRPSKRWPWGRIADAEAARARHDTLLAT